MSGFTRQSTSGHGRQGVKTQKAPENAHSSQLLNTNTLLNTAVDLSHLVWMYGHEEGLLSVSQRNL